MNTIRHTDYNSLLHPSEKIWAGVELETYAAGRGLGGVAFHEDFAGCPPTAGGVINSLIFGGDATLAAAGHATLPHTVRLSGDTTDEDAYWLASSGGYGGLINLKYKATKFWFETRLAVTALVEHGLAIGLMLGTATTGIDGDVLVDATGVLEADRAFIGFHAPLAAAEVVLEACYKAAGTAHASRVTALAAAHTFVANTFVKLGLTFDGEYLKYWVNGVVVATVTVTSATMSGFPTQTVPLLLLILTKSGSAAVKPLDVDWVRVAAFTE